MRDNGPKPSSGQVRAPPQKENGHGEMTETYALAAILAPYTGCLRRENGPRKQDWKMTCTIIDFDGNAVGQSSGEDQERVGAFYRAKTDAAASFPSRSQERQISVTVHLPKCRLRSTSSLRGRARILSGHPELSRNSEKQTLRQREIQAATVRTKAIAVMKEHSAKAWVCWTRRGWRRSRSH